MHVRTDRVGHSTLATKCGNDLFHDEKNNE